MLTLGKIYITALILYVLIWGAVELLWEDDRISDEVRDSVKNIGENVLALTLVGGIVIFAIALIAVLWK